MTGAIFALTANIAIALLIAGAFFILGRVRGAPPAVHWFGVSYTIGAVTPASEILVRLTPVATGVFATLSFTSFALGFALMAAALARYYGVPARNRLLGAYFSATLVVCAVVRFLPRESAAFAILYQIPFAVGTVLCTLVVLRGVRGPLDRLLAGLFALATLHFLLKPVAAYLLGAGPTARDYVASTYALFSQAATGLVLVAVALALILVVVVDMTAIIHRDADQDGLSGLLNRRAFDREAAARLGAGGPAVALMVDIDHFKQVNDTHGHAAGDRVIQAVAAALAAHMPRAAVLGRTGGEEFSVLLPGLAPEAADVAAEALRSAIASRVLAEPGIRITISIGIVVHRDRTESLSSLMVRADRALYAAKAGGRNRVVRHGERP